MNYYIMDGRANYDIDAALVHEVCASLQEAKRNIKKYSNDSCIVSDNCVIYSPLWDNPPRSGGAGAGTFI